MSRAFTPAEAVHIEINTGDEKLQRTGKRLMRQLFEQLGPGKATTVMYVALTEALIGVLHIETPMPEANIQAIHQLLNVMRENIANHEECAIHLSEAMTIAQALEHGDPEPPEEQDSVVTVH